MDVLTLRAGLTTVLSSHLGIYTLANGATTPAISVRATGESLPAGTRASGIEAVLLRDPTPTPEPSYRNQRAFRLWTLFLVDWGTGNDLHAAAEAVLLAYPGTEINTVRVPEGAGPRSQLRLVLRTNPKP